MSWIKRNLFFFIGSIVALLLMGLTGWHLYSKWKLNDQILADLKTNFEELRGLTTRNPHPGDSKTNNIQLAREQQLQLSNFIAKARPYFEPIPPLPAPSETETNITDRELTTALSRTIDQLQKQATASSVTVSSNYYFSFEALRGKVSFDPKGLMPLATQLGEVKAICDILFDAKINALDYIRRERVAVEDSLGGLQTDYLIDKKTTNDLAILTPYEVTFKCFSSELAAALAGFASSRSAIIIKTINVEGAPVGQTQEGMDYLVAAMPPPTYYTPNPATPAATPGAEDAQRRMMQRYGIGPGARGGRYGGGAAAPNVGGVQYRGFQPPPQAPPAYAPPANPYAPATVATAPRSGGLPTVLDERQLKVTANLLLVKLLPPK